MTDSRPNLRLEKELMRGGHQRIAAMDEVGRGALAGPVSVGVVVVTARIGRVPPGLKDSKLLSPQARETLLPAVRRWAGEFAVGHASPAEIDAIGIIGALRLAGRRALAQLTGPVDAVLLDGNHDYLSDPEPTLFPEPALLPEPALPAMTGTVYTRIKADLTCAGVAGASVLAKTERDGMLRLNAKGYLSTVELPLTFGLGRAGKANAVKITWPSGKITTLKDLSSGRFYRIDESRGLQ